MSARYPSASLDLSGLPPPDAIKSLDVLAIIRERKAGIVARLKEIDEAMADEVASVLDLESEPLTKLTESDAYRELLDLAAINDAVRAVMLPYSRGADLDVLSSLLGVRRLTITSGDSTLNPPRAAVMERDEDLISRAQIALEGTAPGLTSNAYVLIAKSAAPEVKSVGLVKRVGGQIEVVLQGRTGDGTVSLDTCATVLRALTRDDSDIGDQLTDIVSVRSVEPLAYDIACRITIPYGPSAGLVKSQAEDALGRMAASLQVIGGTAPTDAFVAAGRVGGVQKLVLASPLSDVVASRVEAPFCRSISVVVDIANG